MEHYNKTDLPINAIDIGVGTSGSIYTLDPYGTPELLTYNAKERIYMTSATQTSTLNSGTANEH